MLKMEFYSRTIYFKDGIALGTLIQTDYDSTYVVALPSEHPAYPGPIRIVGKTLRQIEAEVAAFMPPVEAVAVYHAPRPRRRAISYSRVDAISKKMGCSVNDVINRMSAIGFDTTIVP